MEQEILQALKAIAEGYNVRVEGDQFIIVERPDYTPINGLDPYYVIDVYEYEKLLKGRK